MNRRSFLTTSLLFAAALASASCGPPYTYLRQSAQSPLLGARAVAIEPVHFEGMTVGSIPEAQWLSRKTPEQVQSYMVDRVAFASRFLAVLSARSPVGIIPGPAPDPSVLILRPIIRRYEPGFYAVVFTRPSEVDLVVQVLRTDGTVVDEIQTRATVAWTWATLASGTRFRLAGDVLGSIVAQYLQRRQAGMATREVHRL